MTGAEELFLAVAGVLTSLLMGALKAVSRWARDLPKPAKTVAVTVLAMAVAMGAKALGVPVPEAGLSSTPSGNWQPVVQGILVAVMAMGSRAAAKAVKEHTADGG